MSKYIINHVCGHQSVTDICGKVSERDSRAEWLGTFLCPECQAQARAEKAARAAAENAASGLPALTGSPKQVAWAESLRAAMLANANAKMAAARKAVAKMVREARANYRNGVIAVRPTTAFLAQFLAHPSCPLVSAAARIEKIRTEKSAKWFIENR